MELTVVDLNQPDIAQTVSTPVSIAVDAGRIAFECGWGSPVILDDVRIYRALDANAASSPNGD